MQAGESYQTLCKTTFVCFINETRFKEVAEYHLIFRPRDEKSGTLLSDDLEIHLIELPKFTKTPEQLTTALDRWCYFLRHGADLDPEALPPTLDVPIVR